MSFNDFKDKGNEYFKIGKYAAAVEEYKSALKCTNLDQERLSIYKNLSACFLKLKEFDSALSFALKSLEINGSDEKALFRKVKAKEGLKRYREALKDGLALAKMYPQNASIQDTLRDLNQKIEELEKDESSLLNRLRQTLLQLKENKRDEDKQIQAANNLLVLARDKAVCPLFIEMNVLNEVKHLLFNCESFKLKLALIRVINETCYNNLKMTKIVLSTFDFNDFLNLMSTQVSIKF